MSLTTISRGARRVQHAIAGRLAAAHSQLYLVADDANWVLKEEMREVAGVADRLGIKNRLVSGVWYVANQATFHSSQYILLHKNLPGFSGRRVGLAYFHGLPGTPGEDDLNRCYQRFCQYHRVIDRVQVSHTQMRDVILESGIAPGKVHLIRIGINTDYFPHQTPESKRTAREKLGLPQSAVVIGSFQKDGQGWGQGLEPKLIKGPDVLCETLSLLKHRIPELHVLLTGPARGYVMKRLREIDQPYTHHYLDRYADVGLYYQALDAYVVASRQEGGPKAVLEAMSSGVPIVSTRVGQAMDIIKHSVNGWMVDSEDIEGLAHWTHTAVSQRHDGVLAAARATAEENTYQAQAPLWAKMFDGFVSRQ